MLITERYRELNAQKHESSKVYGTVGASYVSYVQDLARQIGAHTILDYGCGKRTLEKALGYAIHNYDPAIKGCEGTPEPADLVVCTDVMEHIEPESLDEVLDDLKRVTKQLILITVATTASNKTLADGRNTHLIVEQADWWLPKIMQRFILTNFIAEPDDKAFLCICKALPALQ